MTIFRHSTLDDVTAFLNLRDPATGAGITGATPEIAIRRIRESKGGAALDGFYYDGAGSFTNVVTFLSMAEFDATNQPGLYTLLFEQSLVQNEHIYLFYFRNTVAPAIGFVTEEHIITDEIMIPASIPAVPVLPGDTVMGRLAAMESPTGDVALANADAVWDEVLSTHLTPGSTGEALNKAALCGGGVGASLVGIAVETIGAVPISGVQVDVYLSGNFVARYTTDITGQVQLALDDNVYEVYLFASGYAFTVPETLTVSGDTDVTYIGTALVTITPPASPDLCAIFGTIRNAAGVPLAGTCVQAFASPTPQAVSGVQMGEPIASTTTDVNGFFQLDLQRSSSVRFTITDAGIDVLRDVPDAPSQDITTWT